VWGQDRERDEFRGVAEFLRDRLKGRRVCHLLPLVWFDEMAWRTVLLSQTLAVICICRNSALGGKDDGKQYCDTAEFHGLSSWSALSAAQSSPALI
jgi:hypothetical protein